MLSPASLSLSLSVRAQHPDVTEPEPEPAMPGVRTAVSGDDLASLSVCVWTHPDVRDTRLHIRMCPLALQPERLRSPTYTMEHHKGHCYEYSTVLVSLLLGASYAAYVVSGYASRELCLNDLTRVENPYPLELDEEPPPPPPPPNRYEVKPRLKLWSAYEDDMEEARRRREEDHRQSVEAERLRHIEELERPPPDELQGQRLHSWVLIIPNEESPDVDEPFFVEAATGRRYGVDEAQYMGVESVWDDTNYWVNLQPCVDGCKDLSFDLNNVSCWEHLLVGEPWQDRVLAKGVEAADVCLQEKHLGMPRSWVRRIEVSETDMKLRYPGGSKQILYKKASVEVHAPMEARDGVVRRVVLYEDYEWEHPEWVVETYEGRVDRMVQSRQNFTTEEIVQKFLHGREDGLKEHRFFLAANSVEDTRVLDFYHYGRYGGLRRLQLGPQHITESFEGRTDFLQERHILFAARDLGPGGHPEGGRRKPLTVVETYRRNPQKAANEDVHVRTFLLTENRIELKYHYEEERVTAQTRVFVKPPFLEKGDRLTFDPSYSYGYQVDPLAPPPKLVDLFYLFEKVLEDEDRLQPYIRDLEDEVTAILKTRSVETAVPKLQVSVYDRERNLELLKSMLAKEKTMREQGVQEVAVDVDYLAPYLARLGNPSVLSAKDAKAVRDACLGDYKQTLVGRANALQAAMDKISQLLDAKRQWHEEERERLSAGEEEDYYDYCNAMAGQLHLLEVRLARHRDLAPRRYQALEASLRRDARLAVVYW